jgi:hypothetical protein
MALRIKKMCPSASYLSGHEGWMLLLLLMLAQISIVIGQSKVFVLPLPPNPAQCRSCLV